MSDREPCDDHDRWMPRCDYCRGLSGGTRMTPTHVYLVEETPIDPHYPPHVVGVYKHEENAVEAAEGNIDQSVREAEIEDMEVPE